MMNNLFAYGTLMCSDILADVAGIQALGTPAFLQGFRRHAIQGEAYPAIVPDDSGIVEGILYFKLPDSAWKRLDAFEGELYERQTIWVNLKEGGRVEAETYVFHAEFQKRLKDEDWDFLAFLEKYKPGFMKEYEGYDHLKRLS